MSWAQQKRKFAAGRTFTDLFVLLHHLLDGGWVYFRHKPMHPSVMLNWSVTQLRSSLRRSYLYYAERTDDGGEPEIVITVEDCGEVPHFSDAERAAFLVLYERTPEEYFGDYANEEGLERRVREDLEGFMRVERVKRGRP